MLKGKRLLMMLTALLFVFLTACSGGKGAAGSPSASAPASSQPPASQSASQSASPAGDTSPIKIGVIFSFTGSLAPLSDSMKEGIELFLNQNNRTIAGHPVEIKYEDDEGNPQVGLRKYRSLVDNDKVDILIGTTNSAVLAALTGEIAKDKVLTIVSNAASNGTSWKDKNDYIWRVSHSNWQNGGAGAKYFFDNVGKTAIFIGPDFPAGHEVGDAFIGAFEAAGGKVLKSQFPKLGTNDFATYITEIASTKPDFVFTFLPGTDGIRFAQQYKQFGVKIPLTSTFEHGDALITDPAGANAEGILANVNWVASIDNAANKKFIEDFKKNNKGNPNISTVNGYDAAQLIMQAVKKAGGSKKTDDLVNALKTGITLDSPKGSVTIDPKTHNPVQNWYITKNVLKDGHIVQEIMKTLPDVVMPEQPPAK